MTTVDPQLLSHVRYRCIGPTRGGRVVTVSADPQKQNVFWFGAVAGGVWKSDDAGQYWECVTDGQLTTSSIGALAVAPSDGNVIYAGTGEATIRIDVTHGDGIYRSTDGGVNWKHLGLTESRHIGKIAVHPDDCDTVYVAALGHSAKDNPERGLYRTTNGGETWDLVLHVSDGAGAVDVSIDKNNPRIIFATIWQARRNFWSMNSGGPDCGLWRSLDGGDTWTNITRNDGLPDGTVGKIGVVVSPAQSGRVWALIEAEGRKRGLYRSDDNGESWIKTSSKPELAWRPWYYMHVVAHPTNADTVFVMNADAWKSVDGGKTFEQFHTPHGDNHDLWIDPTNPDRMIGADDGGAWVSMNAGLSWSTIYNQMTAQLYHVATDDQFPYLVYGTQQDNSSIAVPSQTGKGAINWGDCYSPGTAESGYIAPKPGDANIVYVGAIGSSPGGGEALQRFDKTTGQVQLVSIWPEGYHDGNTAEVRFQWTYPIVFSPQDANTLYACGNKVFKTTNEGHSWSEISPDLTYADPDTMGVSGPLTMDTAGAEMYATIFSFIASAHSAGTLMTGSDDGRVHVSRDDGASWTEVTPPGLEKFSQITMLAESPHAEGTVYMTVARHKNGDYSPYVYKTTDFGEGWERIDAGLPDGEFCRVVREDPNRQAMLYVGTELGLWVSFDDGANWQSLQLNLPVTPVYDLVVKDTDLVVATHGRSFWILDDLTQVHQAAEASVDSAATLFTPRDAVRTPPDLFADFWGAEGGKNYHVTIGQNATFYLDEDETGHQVKRPIDSGTDLERGVRVSYWLADVPDEPATLTILDSTGAEIDSFTSDRPEDEDDRDAMYCTARAGMNSFVWDMRSAAGPKMLDATWHSRPKAPLCVPGEYQVRLDVGGESMTKSFNLIRDPRVTTSDEDFAAQHGLLSDIQAKLGELVEAVNGVRAMKKQVDAWKPRLTAESHSEVLAAGESVVERLDVIEQELVQPEFTSKGDSLNYREKLFERLSGLPPVVGSADTKPTEQSYKVYEKLAAQIDEQLGAYTALHETDVAALNEMLAELDQGIIGA